MNRFELYCNIEFLFSLYDLINQPIEDFLNSLYDIEYNYIQLYKLIHQHSDIIIDIEDDELIDISTNPKNENYNPNFKKFFKTGRNHFMGMPEQFEYMNIDEENYFKNINNPQALFLLSKSEQECKELENKYGMLFISKNNLQSKLSFLFNIDIVPITKDKSIADWDFLEKYRHPFNSMLIADNYLLKENVENNLLQLLKHLLPNTLSVTEFHLTILTSHKATSSFNIEKRYKTILEYLNKTFSYKFKLTIVITDKIHDRNIITNYMWINSGYGFSLFKNNKVKNETNLFVITIFNIQKRYKGIEYKNTHIPNQLTENNVFVAVDTLIKNYKKINKETPCIIGHTKNVVGNKENRLLDK